MSEEQKSTVPSTVQRSDAQRDAARRNGAKSRGPATPEGKAASSRNALKHGLSAQKLLLANEDPTMFQALLDDFTLALKPRGPLELALVADIAYAKWRQYRIWTSEVASINTQMARNCEALETEFSDFDEPTRTADALASTVAIPHILRADAACFRQFHKALAVLHSLQQQPKRKKAK